MAFRLVPLARVALAALALAALTAMACASPFAANPTPSPTASPTQVDTATPVPTDAPTRTAAPSATAAITATSSQAATPTRTATKTRTATPSDTPTATATPTETPSPTEAGVGATEPMVYSFFNNCAAEVGTWHVTITGPAEAVVEVPLGETVTGQLPPGQYTFLYDADNGASDGPFGFFSDDGPVEETFCPAS